MWVHCQRRDLCAFFYWWPHLPAEYDRDVFRCFWSWHHEDRPHRIWFQPRPEDIGSRRSEIQKVHWHRGCCSRVHSHGFMRCLHRHSRVNCHLLCTSLEQAICETLGQGRNYWRLACPRSSNHAISKWIATYCQHIGEQDEGKCGSQYYSCTSKRLGLFVRQSSSRDAWGAHETFGRAWRINVGKSSWRLIPSRLCSGSVEQKKFKECEPDRVGNQHWLKALIKGKLRQFSSRSSDVFYHVNMGPDATINLIPKGSTSALTTPSASSSSSGPPAKKNRVG